VFISSIVSGGQTGADQGGMRAARRYGIPVTGYVPRGWLTEDGPSPWLRDYGLMECDEPGYPVRTWHNVRMSNAVIWFGNPHSPGGKLTLGLAVDPWNNVDGHFVVVNPASPTTIPSHMPKQVADWLRDYIFVVHDDGKGVVVMIAGNRESKSRGIGERVESFMGQIFELFGHNIKDV
jgi:hypothetical protein